MKKVLVIMGSPRKGDGYKAIGILEEKLKAHCEVSFEYLFLKNQNLSYCLGCLTCMRKAENSCPLKDDAAMLKEKLLSADGLIFYSPVYVHTVTALLKNFFDRFAFFCHRPQFHGIPAIIVAATELSGVRETIDYMSLPVQTWGCNIIGKLAIFSSEIKKEGVYRNKTMDEMERLAKDFSVALIQPALPVPNRFQTFFFNALKFKVGFHREMLPYDYEFWQERGWLKCDYFYDTKINPVYRFLALFQLTLMKKHLGNKFGLKL